MTKGGEGIEWQIQGGKADGYQRYPTALPTLEMPLDPESADRIYLQQAPRGNGV